MRHYGPWVLVLLAGACGRDLSLPSADRLRIEPDFAALAPREALDFEAGGGGAGKTYAFAEGGRLSGDDATLDPATGLYRAGSAGSAQDLVEVRDASGGVAAARVSVGPRLRLTPALAVVAPGGAVTLVASGGKPPYAFTLAGAQAGSTLGPGPDAESRTFTAGTQGDRIEQVVVTDGLSDAGDPGSPVAAATVQLGPAIRLYANAPSQVAPTEALDFLAVGGQPPYTFGFAAVDGLGKPPSGGSIDPVSGRYLAGPIGEVEDRVVVADALGQRSAPWPIAIGPRLALTLPVAALSPDVPVQLVASGGKAPYRFGFAVRGNRSNGAVAEATGLYTPGPNQGASDLLQVADSTAGGSAVLSDPPRVGFVEIDSGQANTRVVAARLRGDYTSGTHLPREDVVVEHVEGTTAAGFTTVIFPPGVPPEVSKGYAPEFYGKTYAEDVDGDAHDEVLAFSQTQLAVFGGDAMGNLALLGTYPYGSLGVARSRTTSLRYWTTTPCTPAGGGAGVERLDFVAGVPQATCEPLTGLAANLAGAAIVTAGDFDGDGFEDLAWSFPGTGAPVNAVFGGATGFGQASQVQLPLTCFTSTPVVYQADGRMTSYLRRAQTGDAKAYAALGLVCTLAGTQRQAVVRFDGGAPGAQQWTASAPIDVGRPVGTPPVVLATQGVAGGPEHLVVVSGGVRDVTGLWFDAAGAATAHSVVPGELPATANWVAFPDTDGDGVPDIVIAGTSPYLRLLRGDGDGSFGGRLHFEQTRWTFGDVDGDGLSDLVAADEQPSLWVAFGGDHQVAWSQQTPSDGSIAGMALGVFGRGVELVWSTFGGEWRRAGVHPDGTLGPMETIALATTFAALQNLRPADFGKDGLVDFWTASTVLQALLLDTPTHGRIVSSTGLGNCLALPVGTGDAATPIVGAAACRSGSAITLMRTAYTTASGAFSPWTDATPPGFLPGDGVTPFPTVIPVGAVGSEAWWVVTPGGPSDATRHRYLLKVAPGATPTAAFVVTTHDLGLALNVPSGSALAGDVDGADRVTELVLLGSGVLTVHRPVAGTWTEVARTAAGGMLSALARLGPGTDLDVVVSAGGGAVVIVNEGGVSLR